jgi:hypothetical protein
MRETQERTIDDITYRVRQLPVKEAENVLIDLLKLLGPSAAASVGEMDLSGGLAAFGDKPLSAGVLVSGIRELADRLDKETYHRVCDTLAKVTDVQRGDKWPQLSGIADELWRGRIQHKWKWLKFALEVQYADFFGGWAALVDGVVAAVVAKSSSSSQATSGGASGAS